MSDNTIIVKILEDQTEERLDKSKKCGTLKQITRESLDDKKVNINQVFISLIDKKLCFAKIEYY